MKTKDDFLPLEDKPACKDQEQDRFKGHGTLAKAYV